MLLSVTWAEACNYQVTLKHTLYKSTYFFRIKPFHFSWPINLIQNTVKENFSTEDLNVVQLEIKSEKIRIDENLMSWYLYSPSYNEHNSWKSNHAYLEKNAAL